MNNHIEIPEKDISKSRNQYVKKRPVRKKRDFFTGAKPKKGNAFYNYLQREQEKEEFVKRTFRVCNDNVPCLENKVHFVDEYLYALSKRCDIIPTVHCCRSYLLAHDEIFPAVNKKTGYKSFCNETGTYFHLPSYKWMGEGNVFWRSKDSYYTFPLSLPPTAGLRLDVQYMFLRDVSVYMIPKALKIRNTMNTIPYTAYPIPYKDTSKDDKLYEFLSNYKNIVKKRHMTEDITGFQKMLFTNFGQHRFVLERTDTNRIVAVLIWDDTGEIIHMLYTVGFIEPKEWYGFSDWRKYAVEKCLRYPETILRYEFMKRFPKGTLFNGGGCGCSLQMKWMNQISQPCHIYELRTSRNVLCKKVGANYVKPCGELPFEYCMPTSSKKWWVDNINRVLFDKTFKKKLSQLSDPEQIKRELKHRKRSAYRFLKMKELGEKCMKNLLNETCNFEN